MQELFVALVMKLLDLLEFSLHVLVSTHRAVGLGQPIMGLWPGGIQADSLFQHGNGAPILFLVCIENAKVEIGDMKILARFQYFLQ